MLKYLFLNLNLIIILLSISQLSDSQRLQDLSYGSDTNVLPISTSQPTNKPTSSSILKKIKNFFGGESTTTVASTTNRQTLTSSNNPYKNYSISSITSNTNNQKDYLNSNIYISTDTISSTTNKNLINYNSNIKFNPLSSTPTSLRNYVNPNVPTRPSTFQSSVTNPSTTLSTTHQNFINGNSNIKINPLSSTPTSLRNYVNPNVPTRPSTSQNSLKSPSSSTASPSKFSSSNSYDKNFPPLSNSKENELATDEEIYNLTETLLTKDVNNHNKNVIINYQQKTRSSDSDDKASQPLLSVKDEVFQSPTISKMISLYNNYELDTTINEYVTPIERKEENDFIDEVLKTQVMRKTMLFLQSKGIVTLDPETHRTLLKTIWFTLYSRVRGKIGSSAFEHIFLSEIKNGTISGLHNWIYFYEQERQGHIDYKGYMDKLELGTKGAIIKFRFQFNGIMKPVNTMFIGTSPELEMALYTICFKLRPNKNCQVSLNNKKFNIVTFLMKYRGKDLIGSAYPEIQKP